MSDGAMSRTPRTSAGLSGSPGSAAMRSHRTRSADCAEAGECKGVSVRIPIPTHAIATTPDRFMTDTLPRHGHGPKTEFVNLNCNEVALAPPVSHHVLAHVVARHWRVYS